MDAFTLTDSGFDFMKPPPFSEEEIKLALQKGLDSPTSPFTIPNANSFDFASFFGEEQKDTSSHADNATKNEEDQPVPSIESIDGTVDVVATTQAQDVPMTTNSKTGATVPSVQNELLPPVSSDLPFPTMTGLKGDATDPILFNFDNFDDLFGSSNDQGTLQFEEPSSAISLASPFELPPQPTTSFPDFAVHNQNLEQMTRPQSRFLEHKLLAVPHLQPPGRRRSQTLPADFEPGMPFHHHAISRLPPRQTRPPRLQPFHPHLRGRYGHHPAEVAHPYPLTPPTRQQTMPTPRPQSLHPDLRTTIIHRTRELSPKRSAKRQKTSHNNADADMSVHGLDQTMAAVESLLRDAVERVKYGREEEIEKARSQARTLNATVLSLEGLLVPLVSKDAPPMDVPCTGAEIRKLNTQGIQSLLDFFDVPFVSTMFLHDKKLLYLNFVGASGTLKHLVLD